MLGMMLKSLKILVHRFLVGPLTLQLYSLIIHFLSLAPRLKYKKLGSFIFLSRISHRTAVESTCVYQHVSEMFKCEL